MITSENNHHHQHLPNMAHHISTPSLEVVHNNKINSLNLTRSSFECNNIRKKQPRTNPNYVNIQVKTTDGSLRNRYIRINDVQGSQISTFSSSSSNSSSGQDSMDCNSQFWCDESNGYFPSDETISTSKTNNEQKSDTIINQKYMNENEIDNALILTTKEAAIVKQSTSCIGSKSIFYYDNLMRN